MPKVSNISKAVMFTDMKNFSLKTSLLTHHQIDELLDKQDEIILGTVKKYSGKVVKTVGDSFMVIFSDPVFSILCAIEIQELSRDYNKKVKINLFKVEFRISITYGTVNKKNGIKGKDYFGDVVNLSSRIQERTPENCIFIDCKLQQMVDKINYINTLYIGTTTFKGIFNKINIYSVLYKKEDLRLNSLGTLEQSHISKIIIDNKFLVREKKVEDIIFKVSSAVAVMSLQPIPFLDATTIIPLQIYLIHEIGKIYKVETNKDMIVPGLLGLFSTFTLSQGLFSLAKMGMPFVGGYIIMPINFSLTYGLGKVINQYFYYKSNNIDLDNDDMKELFKDSRKKGEELVKKERIKVLQIGGKYKDILYNKIKTKKNK